jgi:hypothetical protein
MMEKRAKGKSQKAKVRRGSSELNPCLTFALYLFPFAFFRRALRRMQARPPPPGA